MEISMDFVFGVAVGWAQTVVGHPIDTMVVWSQIKNVETVKLSSLYRGISVPLACSAMYNSMLFGVYSQCINYGCNYWVAGAVAGIIGSPILCLTDSYKIGLQTKSTQRTLFKGLAVTALLECPANSIYFGVYNVLRNRADPWLAGGLAGMSAWASVYPLDVVKTRLQSGVAKNYRDAIRMGGFHVGAGLCLLRAFLTNALGFYVYSLLK